MRTLDGEQTLVRICIGETDKWHHQSLWSALLEKLRKEGFAGATVMSAIAGFGASSHVHTANILRLSIDLPIIIEVVDTQEHTERLLEILDGMMDGGLVTVEKVRVVKYAARKQ